MFWAGGHGHGADLDRHAPPIGGVAAASIVAVGFDVQAPVTAEGDLVVMQVLDGKLLDRAGECDPLPGVFSQGIEVRLFML